jgi:hypothetical protein
VQLLTLPAPLLVWQVLVLACWLAVLLLLLLLLVVALV